VYTQQESFLVRDAAQRLEQTAERVVARPLPRFPSDGRDSRLEPPGAVPGQTDPRDPDGRTVRATQPLTVEAAGLLENLIRGLSGPDVTVAVLDTQGAVITTSRSLLDDNPPIIDPVSAEQAATVRETNRAIHWVAGRADGSRQVVVLLPVTWRPLTTPGAAPAAPVTLLLEQSASLAAADAALARLGLFLVLGVLGGTLAGVVLGMLFTRGVLRPLDRVATTAEAIAGGDLERRLRLPPGRNEVARLGKTFDYMVGRLVATLEAQRRFVADASHELRTPLTSLKGLSEILMIGAHGNDSRVIEQSARAIHDELDRLGRLVNDLLILSRLDSLGAPGGNGAPAPPRRARMDACATLAAAATQMAALAEGRGVRLAQTCAAPLWIAGDPAQIKQVLLNLLDNALRHTPAGDEVAVRGTIEGTTARIEVRDTGSGIDPQDLPHIFERFYRGDASRSRATGNSGLGLAIVHAIVEAHGGTIDVQSARGAGACFIIRLPLVAAPAADQEDEAISVAAGR
jgi:two-component system OmpR family sensor kinase